MESVTPEEVASVIIQPYFDAVKDSFVSFSSDIEKLKKVKFVVDEEIHNTPRHFAATRDDGLLMLFAPQFVELEHEHVVAILDHEFGHAADFLFPARWVTPSDRGKAIWVTDDLLETKDFRDWKRFWRTRNRDQVELAADSIAYTVIGQKIKYSGDCMLQTFSRGVQRPKGLR